MAEEPKMAAGPARRHLFLRPWWQLLWVVILMSAQQLMLKYGTAHAPEGTIFARWGFPALGSIWMWVGTVLSIVAFTAWLHVLRNVPLALAFNVSQGTFLLIPIGSVLFLGEKISLMLGVGTGMVLLGVLLLVPDLVKVEGDEPAKGREA